MGVAAIPYRYEPTHRVADVRCSFGDLALGQCADETVRISGRILRRRDHGRLRFLDLADSTGSVQLLLDQDTDDAAGLIAAPVGTWIGAEGRPITTRRGELSVWVSRWALLAKC